MCEVTEQCLCTGGILADYDENDRLARKIGSLLAKAHTIQLTSPAGTKIKGVITNRPIQYETGLFREPGQFAALPNCEINISPVEGTTEVVIVCDVRVMGYGVTRDEPVTIQVRGGEVVEVTGGKAAEYLNATLSSFNDRSAYNLAEFAVGLNPLCRPYTTNLEDLGKLGFGHHGIGSNYSIGGKVIAPCHIDVIYSNVSLEIDGKTVLDQGKFLI